MVTDLDFSKPFTSGKNLNIGHKNIHYPFYVQSSFIFELKILNCSRSQRTTSFCLFFFHFNCMKFYSAFLFSENFQRLYYNQDFFQFSTKNASVFSKYALQNKIHRFLDFGRQNIQFKLQSFLEFQEWQWCRVIQLQTFLGDCEL